MKKQTTKIKTTTKKEIDNKECLFCDLTSNKIPSYKVHENKNFVAVLDIEPITRGHTLVISKNHVLNYLFSEEKDSKGLQEFVREISDLLKAKMGVDGITLLTNNFYGQDIPHLHWHIIPRFVGDKFSFKHDPKIDFGEIVSVLSSNDEEENEYQKPSKKPQSKKKN